MRLLLSLGFLFLLKSISYSQNGAITYTNTEEISSSFVDLNEYDYDSTLSECPYTFTISTPPGASGGYLIIEQTVRSENNALNSEQISFLRSADSGLKTIPKFGEVDSEGSFSSVQYASLNSGAIANASGVRNYEFHLLRNWGNDSLGCQTHHQSIAPGDLKVTVFFSYTSECPDPFFVRASDIKESSAFISWETSFPNLFSISVGAVGHTPGEGDILLEDISSSTQEIQGLEASTTYEVFVKQVCGVSESEWSQSAIFTTACEPYVVSLAEPFFDNFEQCSSWNIVNGNAVNAWNVGSAVNNGGRFSMNISFNRGVTHMNSIGHASLVHFYKDFEIPEDATETFISFDWTGSGFLLKDFLRVYVAPISYFPIPSNGIVEAPITNAGANFFQLKGDDHEGNFYDNHNVWKPELFKVPEEFAGSTFRLIFTWRDTHMGGSNPAAIDNIRVFSKFTPTVDLEAIEVLAPSILCLNAENSLYLRVANNGFDSLDFEANPATFLIKIREPNGSSKSISKTKNEGVIASGEQLDILVGNIFPVLQGAYQFSGAVSLEDDEYPINDGPTEFITKRRQNNTVVPPIQLDFTNYTGGLFHNNFPNWSATSSFGWVSQQVVNHFGGQRAVQCFFPEPNNPQFIDSPAFEVDEDFVFSFEIASFLTNTFPVNFNRIDDLLPGDSIYVSVLACNGMENNTIWFVNKENDFLTNKLKTITLSLNDFVGELIQIRIGVSTTIIPNQNTPHRHNSIFFSNFYIGPSTPCSAPTQLSHALTFSENNIDELCVELNWSTLSEQDNSFEIKWGVLGFNPQTDGFSEYTSTGSSLILCNLDDGVTYEFYVRLECDSNEFSAFSQPRKFSIPLQGSSCERPIPINAMPYLNTVQNFSAMGNNHSPRAIPQSNFDFLPRDPIGGIEVVYSFIPEVSAGYSIKSFEQFNFHSALYVMSGGCLDWQSKGIGVFGGSSAPTAVLNLFLEENVEYFIVVATNGSSNINTNSLSIELIDCFAPNSIISNSQNVNEVAVSWNGNMGSNFEIVYGSQGFNIETEGNIISGISESEYTILNLEGYSEISFYVRTVCENGYSIWAGPYLSSVLCDESLSVLNTGTVYEEGFEDDCTTWTIFNGTSPNKWVVGESIRHSGDKSIYISNNQGLSNAVSMDRWGRTIYFYKDFILDDGSDELILEFNWSSGSVGGTSFGSYLSVLVAPTSFNPELLAEGLSPVASNLSHGLFQLSRSNGLSQFSTQTSNWVSESLSLPPNFDGSEPFRMIFMWRTPRGNYLNYSVAVDNIKILTASTVGVEKILPNSNTFLKVFPNPSSGIFNFKVEKNVPNAHLEVFDMAGKLIYNQKINLVSGEILTIDLGFASKGAYSIRISSKEYIQYGKLLKN
ncbi:MAG: T9SS type A sorting domain-containing protein [Luteibaculaceae bacterium]